MLSHAKSSCQADTRVVAVSNQHEVQAKAGYPRLGVVSEVMQDASAHHIAGRAIDVQAPVLCGATRCSGVGRACARLRVVFELVQDAGALYVAGCAVDIRPHHARRVLAQSKNVVRKYDDLVTSRLHASRAGSYVPNVRPSQVTCSADKLANFQRSCV